MRARSLVGSLAAAALLLATASEAGVRIELRSASSGGKDGKPSSARYQVWVDGPSLAVELARMDGAPATRRVVFRSGEQVVWLVDHKRRSYFQVDPQSAAQVSSQVAGLRKGLEQGLESLSPEQRAAVQDLLGELSRPTGPLPEYRLRERGELGRYAEIACARHDVLEGERVVAEVCLADYGKPPLVREQLAAVPALGGFLRRTLEPLARDFPSLRPLAPYASLDAIQGLPLRMRSVADDGATSETTVTHVEAATVDPSFFALPPGYARSWIPPFR